MQKEEFIIEGSSNLEFKPCKKKPIVVHACPINKPFKVKTLGGVMEGKSGDYLMKGVRGELYSCSKEIFEKTYDFVDGDIIINIEGSRTEMPSLFVPGDLVWFDSGGGGSIFGIIVGVTFRGPKVSYDFVGVNGLSVRCYGNRLTQHKDEYDVKSGDYKILEEFYYDTPASL